MGVSFPPGGSRGDGATMRVRGAASRTGALRLPGAHRADCDAMPRFSVNLSFLFGELPFLERFAAAAGAGFGAVEYMSPYEHPPEVLRARLERNFAHRLFIGV